MNKEMTIVWHDLIEDPNDLPPISNKSTVWSEEVYVQLKSGNQFYAAFNKLKGAEKGIWYDKNSMTKLNQETIEAWAYVSNYRNREKRIDDLILKLPVGMIFHRITKTTKTNKYPKFEDAVIVYKYDENKDKIVSCAGFYDGCSWKAIHPYSNELIDYVIGWSPFFEANG